MARTLTIMSIAALLLAALPVQGDLRVLEEYKEHNWSPYMAHISDVSGPGLVVSTLPISGDEGFIKSVQKVLDEYDYGRGYTLNEFDCTNSSQIAWYVLRQKGFDARLIYSNEVAEGLRPKGAKDFYGHVWVVVPKNRYSGGDYNDYIYHKSGGWVPVETTQDYQSHLGYAYGTAATGSWFKANEGWLFNSSREYSLLTGDYYELGKGNLQLKAKVSRV